MIDYIKIYVLAFAIFIGIDFFWLGYIAKDLYRNQIGFIMKDNFNMKAAVVFYLFYIVGLVFFVINRAINIESWQYALFAGALYGFITYGTYNITNLSTLKDWPIKLTYIDLTWGSFLGGVTSYLTFIIAMNFNFIK